MTLPRFKDQFDKYFTQFKAKQTLNQMKAIAEKLKAGKVTPFELSFQKSWIPQLMTALSLGGIVTSELSDWRFP